MLYTLAFAGPAPCLPLFATERFYVDCASDQQLSWDIYQATERSRLVKPVALPYVFREPADQFVKRVLANHPEFDLAVHRGNHLHYISNQQSTTSQVITLKTRFSETPQEAFLAVLEEFTFLKNKKLYGNLMPQRIHTLTIFERQTDTVASFLEQIANNSGIDPSPNASRGVGKVFCTPIVCSINFYNVGRKIELDPIEIAAGKAWIEERLLDAKRMRAQWDKEQAEVKAH